MIKEIFTMRRVYPYPIMNRVAFFGLTAGVVVANALLSGGGSSDNSIGSVSDKFHTLITPAGYAFSIWGIIYLGLIGFSIYQLQRGRDVGFFQRILPWYATASGANVTWLLAFKNEYLGLSVLLMLVLFGSLVQIFRLYTKRKRSLSTTRKFFFLVPFSLYFGWIIAAMPVNIAAWLTSLQLNFLESNASIFAAALQLILCLLGLYFLFNRNNYIVPLVLGWALFAMGIEHAGTGVTEILPRMLSGVLVLACLLKFAAFLKNRFSYTPKRRHQHA